MKDQRLSSWSLCWHWGPQGYHEHTAYTCKLGRGNNFHWRMCGKVSPTPLGEGGRSSLLWVDSPTVRAKGCTNQWWLDFSPYGHHPHSHTQRPCPPPIQPATGLLPKEKRIGPLTQHTCLTIGAACSHLDKTPHKCEHILLGGGLGDPVLMNTY